MHKKSAQSCDETIESPEIRRPLSGSIQDEQLLLEEYGLGDYGTDAARSQESGISGDDMDEKDDEITHFLIIAKPGIALS